MNKIFKAIALLTALLCFGILTLKSTNAVAADLKGEITMEEGISAFQDGDWPVALSKFSEVVKLDPNNASAYHYRGMALLKLNQPEEALKDLLKSKELDPKALDINLDVGQVYQQLGKLDEAEKAYREEIANNPDNADAHFSLGYLLFKNNKFEECISEFAKARELDPNLGAAAKYYEGAAYYKMGDMTPAEASFNDCLAKTPPPELANAANQYLEAIKAGKTSRKNWGIMGSVLYQYDSNVLAVSDQANFPMTVNDENVSDQEDYRTVVTLSLFYRLMKFKPWIVEGRYGFYQSWHNEINIYNLQNHSAGLSVYYTNGTASLGLDYTFSEAWLGTDMKWFSVNHWVGPTFRTELSKKLAYSMGYRHNIEDFHVMQPDRDNIGEDIYCRLDYILLEDKASLALMTGMDVEDADDPAYDIKRSWVKLYVNAKLPQKINAKLTLGYEYEDHFNDEIQNRQDNVYIAELMGYRSIWGPVDGTIGVSYRNNDSNVESLTYDRVIVGGGFVVKY